MNNNKIHSLTFDFFPVRYFLWKLVTVVLIQTAWQDSFTWPLLVFLLSCCIYPLASSCAHTFSTMSARARHICFFFDYGALSFYSLGELVWVTFTSIQIHPQKLQGYPEIFQKIEFS